MKSWQKRIWQRTWDRDGGRCADCGSWTANVHHIVSLGSGWNERLIWQEKNMVCLCPNCHIEQPGTIGAHNQKARYRHISLLAQRFGYAYEDEPWANVVRRGDE